MSFCSSPERKTMDLPASGFGAVVGPSQVVCGPEYRATSALALVTASSACPVAVRAKITPARAADPASRLRLPILRFIGFPSLFDPAVVSRWRGDGMFLLNWSRQTAARGDTGAAGAGAGTRPGRTRRFFGCPLVMQGNLIHLNFRPQSPC